MRFKLGLLATVALILAAAGQTPAAAQSASGPPAATATVFPSFIPLPNGFSPEGITVGRGGSFYVASTLGSAIYAGDLRTGTGAILVPPQPGREALGLKVDQRDRLFVAGAFTGQAYVYDAQTGDQLATFDLAPPGAAFINDVVVTQDAAYFTDTLEPRLFVLPIAPDGALGAPHELPLTGDYVHIPDGFNLNGIEATPTGSELLVDQTEAHKIFRVDPKTGIAREIAIDGDPGFGDGLLLRDHTLYIATGFDNEVRVVELAPDLRSGALAGMITDPLFDVPTTLAALGPRLYVVNARFSTEPGPDVHYEILQVPLTE